MVWSRWAWQTGASAALGWGCGGVCSGLLTAHIVPLSCTQRVSAEKVSLQVQTWNKQFPKRGGFDWSLVYAVTLGHQVLGAVVWNSECTVKTSTCRADPLSLCLLKRETIPLILQWFPPGEQRKLPLVRRLPALTSASVEGLRWSPAQCSGEPSPRGLDTGVKRGRWAKQRPPSSQGSPLFTDLFPQGCWGVANEQCRLWAEFCAPQQHRGTGGGDHSLQLHLAALAQGLNQNLCHQRADASVHPHCTHCWWFRMKSVHYCAMTGF